MADTMDARRFDSSLEVMIGRYSWYVQRVSEAD